MSMTACCWSEVLRKRGGGNTSSAIHPSRITGPVSRRQPARRTAISINRLLHECPPIDLLDMDIQGAEGDVVKAGIDAMTAKVKRAFVSTHFDQIHDELREGFQLAWLGAGRG